MVVFEEVLYPASVKVRRQSSDLPVFGFFGALGRRLQPRSLGISVLEMKESA